MKRSVLTIGILLVLLGGAFWWLTNDNDRDGPGSADLLFHCAAGLRKPMSEIARQYEEEFGVKVNLQFGGSGALASQLELAGGDLYLPADQSYIDSAREKGLMEEAIPVALLTAGLVVPKGNPRGLTTLSDLGKEGLKISLAERSASVGRFTWKVLEEEGLLARVNPNVVVTKPTVNAIVEDVATGAVDVSLAWDAVAKNFSEVEWLAVPEFLKRAKRASIGVLTSSKDAKRALHFARYVTARDRGRKVFQEMGFMVPDEGDKWSDQPEVTLFSGSMLRPAIQERVREFEEREGCRVNTVFEGCGTLVAQMDAGATPAGYFACDTKFLNKVQDRFFTGRIMTRNEIVLLVRMGNPKELFKLKDLGKPGVKLGICDGRKSALGELTRIMLERRGLAKELEVNVAVKVAKGDDLVSAVQARSLDAALVYRSNTLASPVTLEENEIVELNDDLAFAEQPFAVAKGSAYPALMRRLGEFLATPEARGRFEKLGFQWELN
ncbi:MAG TPA: molybdate ABC transporter substrate-binding protein [Verrucomicrobiales bacterium]|nr:molybdate ABC transporter substrate-binding protein [Verrucomicrobiales bacterium]